MLSDMFLHSRFDDADLALERGVIFEEIDMYEDTPEDVAIEKLFEGCFADTALGRPILGTKETLRGMDGEALRTYMHRCYRPEDTVIALSGHFDASDLEYICTLFEPMRGTGTNVITPAAYQKSLIVRPKEIEQNHLCIGFPGLSMDAKECYAVQLLSSMLGGGMSSRLFQNVREQNGLCYSIYSYSSSYLDTGLFSIYTALSKKTETRALSLIGQVLRDFCASGPDVQELTRCRDQLKANILMGMENTSTRMHQLGKGELLLGRVVDADTLIANYDAVSAEEITALARRLFDFNNISLCAVGQTGSLDYYTDLFH